MVTPSPKYFEPGFRQNMEERQIDNLPVKGELPEWLEGTLIRNGPGMVNVDKSMRHWFDGLAMLHKFSFAKGEVNYQSKYLDCEAYQEAKEHGKITYSDFATDPCRSLFQKVQTVFENPPRITDSAKVNIDAIGDKLYAWGEPLMQIQFDPETLEKIGVFHYDMEPGKGINTAHPHQDEAGSYNLVVKFGAMNHYKIYSMTDTVKELASIPVREPGYLHSFGMSKRYFIIAEYPLVVQSLKLLFRQKPFIENFKWKQKRGTRFLIIDRETGKLEATIKTKAFFSFHHVNAFERDGQLVVDIAAYEDAGIIDHYYINRLKSADLSLPFGRMERFVLDVDNQTMVERKVLSEACIELPHIDRDWCHTNPAYRYVYGCGIKSEQRNEFYNQLVKIDIQSGAYKIWYEQGCYPGEAVFIPKPDRKTEDDGVLLSVVLDADQRNSFLLILDAQDLQEIGTSTPPPRHAIWIPWQIYHKK